MENFKEFVDHLLCIIPFEIETCRLYGLESTFAGHPIVEDALDLNTALGMNLKALTPTTESESPNSHQKALTLRRLSLYSRLSSDSSLFVSSAPRGDVGSSPELHRTNRWMMRRCTSMWRDVSTPKKLLEGAGDGVDPMRHVQAGEEELYISFYQDIEGKNSSLEKHVQTGFYSSTIMP
ncbi:hypothetical protein Sjap_002963 [Stephania japonica]|uniref:Lipid-A-disaccharide synthase n=1 Tax=Stephania japonica TaxID=461633 RepID=A0AAP0PT19_9MAGN